MRRDHRPLWVKQIYDQINARYVDWRIKPQLDSVGSDFRVLYPSHLQISGAGIHIGDHVHVMALYDSPVRLSVFGGTGEIRIGDCSIVNPGVRISSASRIVIGHSCMLAMNAYLADADWHDLQHRIFAPGKTAPISIGNNCWIGESAFVGKGVSIGDNSVIGAYSVVTRDVPDNSIVAGVPAKVVGSIDPQDLSARQDMFVDDLYARHERNQQTSALAGNTFFNWLRTCLRPGRND